MRTLFLRLLLKTRRLFFVTVIRATRSCSHLQYKGSFFISQFFMTLSIGPVQGMEPLTFHSAVKRSGSPAAVNKPLMFSLMEGGGGRQAINIYHFSFIPSPWSSLGPLVPKHWTFIIARFTCNTYHIHILLPVWHQSHPWVPPPLECRRQTRFRLTFEAWKTRWSYWNNKRSERCWNSVSLSVSSYEGIPPLCPCCQNVLRKKGMLLDLKHRLHTINVPKATRIWDI